MAAQTIDVKVDSNGRMILPASVRKAMGLHGKAKVVLTLEEDQVDCHRSVMVLHVLKLSTAKMPNTLVRPTSF